MLAYGETFWEGTGMEPASAGVLVILLAFALLVHLVTSGRRNRKKTLQQVDRMSGGEFERWCADLLKRNGFHDVRVCGKSGDQGMDIFARKGLLKYAVQCKCYSHKCGNGPVQEAYAAKKIHGCQRAAVMTNNFFTKGGIEAAQKTGVLLWDREELKKMMRKQ